MGIYFEATTLIKDVTRQFWRWIFYTTLAASLALLGGCGGGGGGSGGAEETTTSIDPQLTGWSLGTPITVLDINTLPNVNSNTVITPNLLLSDPQFYHVETENKGTVDYYGEKDDAGHHLAIKLICMKTTRGQEINLLFDSQNHLVNLGVANQRVIQFDWNTKLISEVKGNINCSDAVNALVAKANVQKSNPYSDPLRTLSLGTKSTSENASLKILASQIPSADSTTTQIPLTPDPSQATTASTTTQMPFVPAPNQAATECDISTKYTKDGIKEMVDSLLTIGLSIADVVAFVNAEAVPVEAATGPAAGPIIVGTEVGAVMGGFLFGIVKVSINGLARMEANSTPEPALTWLQGVNLLVDEIDGVMGLKALGKATKSKAELEKLYKTTTATSSTNLLDIPLIQKLMKDACEKTYKPCDANISTSGGVGSYGPYIMHLGKGSGLLGLSYEFFDVPDQLTISGAVRYSTGCVNGAQSVQLPFDTSAGNFFSGRQSSAVVEVKVSGDCTSQGSTGWNFKVFCP